MNKAIPSGKCFVPLELSDSAFFVRQPVPVDDLRGMFLDFALARATTRAPEEVCLSFHRSGRPMFLQVGNRLRKRDFNSPLSEHEKRQLVRQAFGDSVDQPQMVIDHDLA